MFLSFLPPSLAPSSSSFCPSCSRNEPTELLQARLLSYMPSTHWIIFKCLNSSQPQMSVNHGLRYCSKGFQNPRLPVCPSHCIQDSVQGRLPPTPTMWSAFPPSPPEGHLKYSLCCFESYSVAEGPSTLDNLPASGSQVLGLWPFIFQQDLAKFPRLTLTL